ncbi:MAG TPA: lycopene cyclase family protein, partial [Phaeodactylibacter sp.]|nr:lycopene cyclase family protein [Phaeodactylibacter sp.]
ADFYDKMRQELGRSPSFEFRQEKVLSIVDCGEGAKVETANASYWAPVVFNSCLRPKVSPQPGTHFLLQHFTGWWIETAEDQFDPRSGILMDFRTPQYGSARFFYLLPISKRRALVEYTIFSPEKLQPHHYEEALQKYLKEQCGLNNYRVYERESGAIPMTDKVMPSKYSKYTVNIGTFGGAVKPTTGYAFQNIQRQAKQLVAQMEAGEALDSRLPQQPRFRFYDRLLLNILQHFGEEAKGIFCRLFRYSSMPHILRFLEEKTHLWQEVRIFATLPIITFLRAVVRVYVSRPRSVRSIQPEKRKDVLPTVRAKRKTKKVV